MRWTLGHRPSLDGDGGGLSGLVLAGGDSTSAAAAIDHFAAASGAAAESSFSEQCSSEVYSELKKLAIQ